MACGNIACWLVLFYEVRAKGGWGRVGWGVRGGLGRKLQILAGVLCEKLKMILAFVSTLLGLKPRSGGKPLKSQVVCPLAGLRP